MSAKAWNKGFFLPFFIIVANILIIFAVYSYNYAVEFFYYEKKLNDKTKLYFEAKNYVIETMVKLNRILGAKSYFGLNDLKDIESEAVKDGYKVRVFIEDENSKLNKKIFESGYLNFPDDSKYFTDYGNGIININTAKREILKNVFCDTFNLNNFCVKRIDNPVKNASELLFLKQKYFKKTINSKIKFGVKSNYFKIIVKAKSKFNNITIISMVFVDGKNFKIIYENDEYYE